MITLTKVKKLAELMREHDKLLVDLQNMERPRAAKITWEESSCGMGQICSVYLDFNMMQRIRNLFREKIIEIENEMGALGVVEFTSGFNNAADH